MADRELLVLSLYSLLASNRSGIFLVYFPIFLVTEKGAPVSLALALVSVAYVASSLTGPLAGRWSDRLGRRRPFLLAAEAGALPVFFAIPYLPSAWLAGAAFVVAQVVLALGSPALNAYVSDLTRSRERGRGYGLLNATGYLGQIAGFIAVALLVGPFSINALFPFVAIVMVGSLSVVVFLVPDRPAPLATRTITWAEARPVVSFSVAVSIRALGIGAVGTFFGVYATGLGATESEVAIIAVVGLAVAALTSLPLGQLVDRIGEIRGVWYGTLVSLAGIVVFLLAPSWGFLVPAQAIRLVGVSLYSPAMLAWVSNMAPAGHRAEYLGVFSLVNSTLWSLGPLGGGIALSWGGTLGLFLFAIGTTIVSLLLLEAFYLVRRGGPERGAPSSPAGPVPTTPPTGSSRPLDVARAPARAG
ncbi:MAG TPA: MFS transporter [Thermoplasmata archaeon]|nr:MFS transporter [Thermoplasmata archaeon]